MKLIENKYIISNDKSLLSVDRIYELLSKSYWANNRTRDIIELSIRNSLCYGIYLEGEQVGFARVVTDRATMYWLCDVIVDDKHKGKSLGKRLIEFIVNTDELKGLRGILATKNAHGLYEKYGFVKNADRFMVRQTF